MKKIRGVALLSVLIFLQIVTVIGLYALQMALLENKQSQYSWQKYNSRLFAEQALALAEQQLQQVLPTCLIPVSASADLSALSMQQWQSLQSCAGNFHSFQYYYVVEYLDDDSCALIESYSPATTAIYYRLTLVGWIGNAKTILQSTVVKPNVAGLVCQGSTSIVKVGRQRFREIK